MSNLLFWDVDTQIDFMHAEGKLYVPGAEKIIPNVQRLTSFASEHGILVVADVCAHQLSDPEFAEYPPHCLVGTAGQQKVPGTLLPRHYVIPNRPVPLPDDLSSYPQIVIEKQTTDVFTNPNMDALLAHLGRREVVLYGVVTEICVDLAARGLIQRGYRVHLVQDAVQHFDAANSRATVDEIVRRGGQLTTTEDVVTGLQSTSTARIA